ncbi:MULTISPECIES: class I SAM-dependent methyltransferase [Prochlorococcus]|uniref:class I SAM-dependent methyltransferase n=1 Tax=Prochlorococcus TaxID=1218 RepID=UPI000533A475|nr:MULTISPECIES: methyltransferase domain-containing protein [Prochlorococcus]KGG11906.1 SAM-dependent methyltransferase [Prochlorococcus sp. MIT 0601]
MSVQYLEDYQRYKEDNDDDELFYTYPRFVNHLDDSFRKRLTQLYRDKINVDNVVLDLMSSWTSHLPEEIIYQRVVGHGLNLQELQRNNRLDSFWTQNFNVNQILPLEDNSIDTCLMVAAWQYLQYPEELSFELRRVIKEGGQLIVSFSNRAFWVKSPQVWVTSSDSERINYVRQVLERQGWHSFETISERTSKKSFLPFKSLEGDPFFSVLAIN